MADDLLITPGSRKLEIKDSSGNIDAKIETDASGNLLITNAGGDISIGDTSSDVFIGDGTNNVDIVFEQDGEIRGTSGVTVTLGSSGSNVAMGTDLSLGGNDLTNVNDLTITGNLTITGDINSYNVTDLDVSDKTITLGVGQTEANSGGSGIVIDGSLAELKWDESDNRWEFNKNLAASVFQQTGTSGNSFYAASFTRSSSGLVTPDIWGSSGTLVLGTSSTDERLALSTSGAKVYGQIELTDNIKATGNNLKFFAGGTHVLNIDLNHHVYPNTHNVCDVGFSSSLAFKDAYFSGQINTGSVVAGGSLALDPDVGNNVTIAVDGTYGTSGTGRYVTLGLGGTSNGSNRVFAHNTGEDGLYLAAATGRGVAIRTNGSGSNTYFFGSGGEMQRNGTNIISSTGTFIGTTGFSSDTSQTGRMYSWKPVTNTSSSGSVYIKIATLTISQSARFSIELIGRDTSYGDGNFPSFGKLVGQLNNDNNVDCVFYDFKSGQNSDGSRVVTNIFTKYISNTSHEIWVHVSSFSELGAFGYVSTGSITPHTANTGQTSSQPASSVTVTKLEMWNSANGGNGSGLDADTLDGVSGEHYLRSNVSDTYSGTLTLASSTSIRLPNSSSSGIHSSTGHRVIDSQDSTLRIGDTGKHNIVRLHGQGSDDFRVYYGATDYQIFHQGNDGSGSGLDADLLDGQHGSHYTNASNLSSGTIPDARLGSSVWYRQSDISVSSTNPFDNSLTATQVTDYGSYKISYTGASAHMISSAVGGSASIFHIGAHYNGDDFYMRVRTDGSSWKNWRKLWHDNNDGSGSGLDADKLDGIQASSFLRSDANDTASGVITFSSTPVLSGTTSNEGGEINFGAPTGGSYSSFALDNYQGHFRVHTLASGKEFRIHSASGGLTTIGSNIGTVWASGNDGASSGLDADLLDGQHGSHYLDYNNFTNTPTVPTNNNQLTNGAGYITGLAFNNLTGKTSGTGEYSTSSYLTAGRGSGGVSLTHNDGYGNANVTFNHKSGVPEQAGNCGRIVVNTDSTTSATMYFELKSNSGTSAINTPSAMELTETGAFFPQYLYHLSDTDTYIRFTDNQVRIFAGGTEKFNSNNTYLTSGSNISVGTINSGAITSTGDVEGVHIDVTAGNFNGLRFWNGSDSYRIAMSAQNATGAGRVPGESTSDYNIYYKMDAGTNRGHVFQSGTTNTAGIDSTGHIRTIGNLTVGSDNSGDNFIRIGKVATGTAGLILTNGGNDKIKFLEDSDEALVVYVNNSTLAYKIPETGHIYTADGKDLYLYHSSGTSGGSIHMPRSGMITFYGDTSTHHAIGSRNNAMGEADDLMISSYGAVYIDLDSNNNNTSGADFRIGRHNTSSGTDSELFGVSGENGTISQNGLDIMTQSSGTLTIGDISDNDEITNVVIKSYAGTSNISLGDSEMTLSGDVYITENLRHSGDANTRMQMTGDRIRLYSGNVEMLDLVEGTTDYVDIIDRVRVTSGGDMICEGDVVAFTSTTVSDINQKENIEVIADPLEKVLKLKGVTFDWKKDKTKSAGIIAQDVEKILPEIVKEKGDRSGEEFKSVDYNGITGLLVEALKEQQTIINRLEDRIRALEMEKE